MYLDEKSFQSIIASIFVRHITATVNAVIFENIKAHTSSSCVWSQLINWGNIYVDNVV